MTFGEHLEELRRSLAKALLWLALGMSVGLFFASDVVRYIETPLKTAIRQFNADRDLAKMGRDPGDPEVQATRKFLMENGLVLDLVYDIPTEFLKSIVPPGDAQREAGAGSSGRFDIRELLSSIPDPNSLVPRIQLRRVEVGLSSLKMEEPFMIWVKAGLIIGAVVASPMIFYHLWSFVAAGLHAHERKYVYVFLPVSVGLFSSGVILAFFLVLHYVIKFLLTFNAQMDVAVEPRLEYYMNFVLLLPLGFGVAFQLPLIMFFAQRIGLVETESYVNSWRIAVLIITALSVVLTPADVTSMVAMMVPLILLYFIGIAMCKYIPRGRGLGSAAYDPS